MTKKCIGCGAHLQSTDISKDGYVGDLEKDLCERCFRLINYGEYKSVSSDNNDYKKIFDSIPKDALVVYLTSVMDFNFDYINDFDNLIVVLTKIDLLPISTSVNKLTNYIKKHIDNYIDIEVISSIKNYNLDSLMDKIKKNSHNGDVYFVGTTNSGKSTLINKIITNYSDKSYSVTTSVYPSTTIDKVTINMGEYNIIDTPGLIVNKSLFNYLEAKDIKRITPKKGIKPRVFQAKKGESLLIDEYIRIDFIHSNNVTIYIDNNIKIKKIYNRDVLLDKYKYVFDLDNNSDIVIPDLCFVKFSRKGKANIYSLYDVDIYNRSSVI